MGTGLTKGGRDFLLLGDFNVMCAYCGRKRKASELVRDNEYARGLYCCPEHADERHPQDYARGVPEKMATPFVQPPVITFTSVNATFPLTVSPSPLVLTPQGEQILVTEGTPPTDITTEFGQFLVTEPGDYAAVVMVTLPGWIAPDSGQPGVVYVTSLLWSWLSGGAGIIIVSPNSVVTQLVATNPLATGILQCVVTNSLGAQASVVVQVSA
jgi:hypothetical protein